MYPKIYTLGEFRDRILKLLNRYSSNGTVYAGGEKADIENRLVTSLNVHLARLLHESAQDRALCTTVFFVPECIGDTGSFTVSPYENVTRNFKGRNVGFYAALSGKGEIKLTTSFGTSAYTVDSQYGAFEVIRGFAGNVEECDCVFEISSKDGLYVKEFTVYSGVFPEKGDVGLLCGKEFSAAYIPSDCAKVLSVCEAGKGCMHGLKTDFEVFSKDRTIVIPRSGKREYVVEYITYAPEFSADDESSVSISPIVADILGYMCAADLCPVNDPELYSKLSYTYREMLENVYPRHRKNGITNRFFGIIGERGIFRRCNGGRRSI